MDKKKYVSPRYELLKFDDSIVTTVASGCNPIVVGVEAGEGPNTCYTNGQPNVVWNEEF